jgi:hypothetical protein
MVVMFRFYWLVAAVAVTWTAAAEARTYALVAAIGSRFEVITSQQQTGTHIPAFDRRAYAVNGNVLNRLALQGLDRAVARYEPESRRIYLSTSPARPQIELVIEELRKVDRAGWDRIMVALPADRYLDEAGLATRMRGFGLMAQGQCQTDPISCGNGFRAPSGPMAQTPSGKEIAANTFVAPFAFVEIVTLDPKTLAVLDRSASYGHRKLADESAKLDGIIDGSNKDFLARQIVELVQTSTADAMASGILKGNVDVREKGPVTPGR